MQINEVAFYQVDLPLKEGKYSWSNGNFVEMFDATIVEIKTDSDVVGYGECTPLGATYLPAYAAGVRTGVEQIASHLIGMDPRDLHAVNLQMDQALLGHPYVKSAIDVACWDILGKSAGMPVCQLLGGKQQSNVELYRAISQEEPEVMVKKIAGYRAEGYTKFQLKVGGDPDLDIARIHQCREILDRGELLVADANTGWTMFSAMRVVRAISELDVVVEQPCRTYEESLSIRRKTSLPFNLDEVITDISTFMRGLEDKAFDAINVKISRLGGLTKARQLRDLCLSTGVMMTIEDTWGSDISTAAIAHLAQSTPEKFLLSTTDFNSYVTVSTADGAPKRNGGSMSVSDVPGLGFEPRMDTLGEPVFAVSA